MNFENMPELKWVNGYFFSLALMFGVDVALYLWFKKIRWL
jgi:magnesium transporter